MAALLMGGSASYSPQDFYTPVKKSIGQSPQYIQQQNDQLWQEAILKAQQANQIGAQTAGMQAQTDAVTSSTKLMNQAAANYGKPGTAISSSTIPAMPGVGGTVGGTGTGGVPTTGGTVGGVSAGGVGYYDPWGEYRDDAADKLGGTLGQGSPSDFYQSQLQAMASGQFSPQDPSYQWRFDQGQKAVERSLAAKGLLNSGNAAIELQQYGQGAASQEYGAQFGRLLQGLSGVESAYDAQMNRLMKMAGVDISPVSVGELGVQQGQLGVNAQEMRNRWALGNRELDLKQQLALQSLSGGSVGGMSGTNWASIFGPNGAAG